MNLNVTEKGKPLLQATGALIFFFQEEMVEAFQGFEKCFLLMFGTK